MQKKTILYLFLDLVFLVVFNTVFFVAGGVEHPASVWISYGFIHFSYIMILLTPILMRKSSSAAVFGFSLYSISAVYFFVEFIVGLIFILIGGDSYKPALVVQVIIAGIYAVMLIANLIANECTADKEEQREKEIAYIKTAAASIKLLIGKSTDKKANKEIERAYDLLHSSPTKSSSSVKDIESDILSKIEDLKDAVGKDNATTILSLCKDIMNLAEERNSILKTG